MWPSCHIKGMDLWAAPKWQLWLVMLTHSALRALTFMWHGVLTGCAHAYEAQHVLIEVCVGMPALSELAQDLGPEVNAMRSAVSSRDHCHPWEKVCGTGDEASMFPSSAFRGCTQQSRCWWAWVGAYSACPWDR